VRGRVVREGDLVTCTGLRWWLRARPHPHGGLEVEAADRADACWRRVDEDLPALLRASVRVRVADAEVAARFADEVARLAGVGDRVSPWTARSGGIPEGDGGGGVAGVEEDPSFAVIRATYPLLASGVRERLPAVPTTLPGYLQPGFRCVRPREAVRRLVGERATKPVVRAVCSLLERDEVPDLYALSVVVGVAPALQPDHLAALLGGAGRCVEGRACGAGGLAADAGKLGAGERAPLSARQAAALPGLVGATDRRRARRLLAAALADPIDRERLRFVAEHRRPAGPTLADVDGWEQLALLVALDGADTEDVA
jgi:hypothetical protein